MFSECDYSWTLNRGIICSHQCWPASQPSGVKDRLGKSDLLLMPYNHTINQSLCHNLHYCVSSSEPQLIPPLPCVSPLSCTQVVGTWSRRWLAQNMSNPPQRRCTYPSCAGSFLGYNYWPLPSFSFRALHTSRGAEAERSGLLFCAAELAPSAGA